MTFELHRQLDADTAEVTRLPLCRVLIMDDTTWPWLILVPQIAGLKDLHDLAPADDAMVMAEIRQASRALQALHRPDKINIAALGNQVPQLHIHVIARHVGDPAWPGPVWGTATRQPYDRDARDAALAAMRKAITDAAI
jgi:diadenosine tetraphosphate (Ap4A) HIT family hydrolase